jgi:hypothetical protein
MTNFRRKDVWRQFFITYVPNELTNPATVVTEIQRQNKCPNEEIFWALIYT